MAESSTSGPGPFDSRKLLDLGEAFCRWNGEQTSARNIGRHLGVCARTVQRWRVGRTVGVQLHVADRITNRTGAYLEDFTR
jgi:hypothetical protein